MDDNYERTLKIVGNKHDITRCKDICQGSLSKLILPPS